MMEAIVVAVDSAPAWWFILGFAVLFSFSEFFWWSIK